MYAISAATPADARAITECEMHTKVECGLETFDDLDVAIAQRADRWARYLLGTHHPQKAKPQRVAYNIEQEGEIVAYIAGHLTQRHGCDGELQSIYIRRALQNHGIGTQLLRRLFAWFEQHEARSVCVCISPDNPYQRFYTKHGAIRMEPHWLMWDNPSAVSAST